MTQDPSRSKKKIPPVAPTYTGADDLFKLKKPATSPGAQQESEPAMQSESIVEEKQKSAQSEQQDEAPDNRSYVTTASQINVGTVPHTDNITSENLTGQNPNNQTIQQYGQQASIPLKKSAIAPTQQKSVVPPQQPSSQIVERRTVEVTIRIYEDQRREIEDILRNRVNALIDNGVEVDRRKYQISIIYTELLDFALSLVKQQKQNK